MDMITAYPPGRVPGDLTILGDTIRTVDNTDLTLLPDGTGITIIGDAGSTSHALASNDDLFVSGKLEVDGTTYIDGVSFFAGANVILGLNTYGGAATNVDSVMLGDNIYDQLILATGVNQGRQLIITDSVNYAKDHDHATLSDPAMYGHSSTDPNTDNTQWWSLTHDQTDAVIGVGKGDLLISTPANKTIRLGQPVWDDLRVPLTRGFIGSLNPPTFTQFMDNGAASVGVYALTFADQAVAGNEEQVWFNAQLPHAYKEGTDIDVHIHWSPAVSGAAGEFVKWGFEYTWVNVDGTFGNTTIITSDASAAGTATTSGDGTLVADKHYVTEIGTITGTSKSISSMLVCRLFRNSSHADDDLAQAAFGFEVDFHYQIDTLGSRQEYTK